MKLIEECVSRRRFLKLMGGIGGAAGFYLGWYEQNIEKLPSDIIIRLHNFSENPDDVAKEFLTANSPTLMAIYSKFFSPFIDTWYHEAILQIKNSTNKLKTNPQYAKNHHRIDALPAVVSAHLLPVTLLEEQDKLFEEISIALEDPRREVKEIVIQNLISVSSPNFDSVNRFSINFDILKYTDYIIEQAKDTSKLLTSLCLCLELLLNSRSILIARESYGKQIKQIDKRLQKIKDFNVPYFKYLSHLIDIHIKLFAKADPYNHLSLPPQQTEALLGYKNFPASLRPYFKQLSIILARRIYDNWLTATGVGSTSYDVLSPEDAKKALPKGLSWLKYFEIRKLLPRKSELSKIIPNDEKDFKVFLETTLDQLIDHPDKYSIDISSYAPSKEEFLLYNYCVPFSQFSNPVMLNKQSLQSKTNRRDLILRLIRSGFAMWGGKEIGSKVGGEIFDLINNIFNPRPPDISPSNKSKKEILDEAENKSTETEIRAGKTADKLDSKLGPNRIQIRY